MLQLCTLIQTTGHDVIEYSPYTVHILMGDNKQHNVLGRCWATMSHQTLESSLHVSETALER